MRRTAAALVTAALLGLPVPAQAGCVGPGIDVPGAPTATPGADHLRVVVLRPGERVVVQGEAFYDGPCDDTGTAGGCGAAGPAPLAPRQDVPLQLTRGASSQVLARADAGQDLRVRWEVVVPPGTPPGPALLEADAAQLKIVVAAPR